MEPLKITLLPEAQRLIAAAPSLPARMLQALCGALDEQNELTVGYSDEKYLSQRGTRTLGVITNRLRGSLRKANAVVAGQSILSAIGSNVKYARVHEFGFDGTVQVKQYTRRIFSYSRKPPGGRVSAKTGKLIVPSRKRLKQVGQVVVKAHQAHMKMPQRSFIQRPIQDRKAEYARALSRAAVAAIENTAPGAN